MRKWAKAHYSKYAGNELKRGNTVFQILLIAFIAIPILEIYLLFQVGGIIGAGWTILIVIGTAILGASLLRQQGFATWARLNQSIAQGQLPPTMLIEGVLLLLSGAFLLTPGFFTDAVGFLFLTPFIRKIIAASLLRRGVFMASSMSATSFSHRQAGSQQQNESSTQHTNVIEGEYEERKDKD